MEELYYGARVVVTATGRTGRIIALCADACHARVLPDIPWSSSFVIETWKLARIDD